MQNNAEQCRAEQSTIEQYSSVEILGLGNWSENKFWRETGVKLHHKYLPITPLRIPLMLSYVIKL